jgi:hypothetical protein
MEGAEEAPEDDPPRGKTSAATSMEEVKRRRHAKRHQAAVKKGVAESLSGDIDAGFAAQLSRNEDELLQYVAKVNRVYQEKLKKPAPFMNFVSPCQVTSLASSIIVSHPYAYPNLLLAVAIAASPYWLVQ